MTVTIVLTNTAAGLKWTVPPDWDNATGAFFLFGGGQAGMTPDASNSLSGLGGASGYGAWAHNQTLSPGDQLDFQIGAARPPAAGATVTSPAVTDADLVNTPSIIQTIRWTHGNDTWMKKTDGTYLGYAPGGQTNVNRFGEIIGSDGIVGSDGTHNELAEYAYIAISLCGEAGLKLTGAGGGGAGAPGDPFTGIGFAGGPADIGQYPAITVDGANCAIGSVIANSGIGGGAGVTGLFVDPDGSVTPRTGTYGAAGATVSLGGDGGAPGTLGTPAGVDGAAGGAYYDDGHGTTAGPGGGGGGGAGGLVYEFDTGTRHVNPPAWGTRQKTDVGNTLFGPATGGDGGDGGLYSAGGGGGANAASTNQANMGVGGIGAQGFIVIRYEAAPPAPAFTFGFVI